MDKRRNCKLLTKCQTAMTEIMKEALALIGARQQKAVRGKIVANWANLVRL